MKSMRLFLVSTVAWCAVLVGGTAFGQTIVRTIPLPNTTYWNQAYDIAAVDTSSMYIVSSTSTTSLYNYGFIYRIDNNGNRIDSISTGLGQSQGIAYDGTSFYFVRRYTSTCTIIRTTLTGTVIDSLRFVSPTRLIGGAVWDGSHVWVSDYTPTPSTGRPAVLLKINWSSKTIEDSIVTIGLQPTGVAWDGQNIFYAMDMLGSEPNLNLIYVVDPVSGDTVRTILMPEPPTTDSNPRGLTWDGRYLWLIARPVGGGTGQVLYKYDLTGSGTPAINVPVRFFDLGQIRIGNSAQTSALIQSTGSAPLRIDSVRMLYSSDFSTNLVTPLTIPAGGSSSFTITFTPTRYGLDSAQVVLYHNDPARPPQVVRVHGTGIYPSAYLGIPASRAFGLRRVHSTNMWILTIQNQGPTQLNISSATFSTPNYYLDPGTFPLSIDSLGSRRVRMWFQPTSATSFVDTMRITSNASNGPVNTIVLSGSGDATGVAIGSPHWEFRVPDHPVSNTFRLVKAVRSFNDITGDGKPDMIVSTENYWTMAVNGNASVDNDSLWAFTSYVSNSSAGSIGTTGDYSHQKALGIASDLNGDGFNDVVIGTGGGNERVYALNGRTGAKLWSFGTDHPDSFGLGDFTGIDVSTDFNNDGVPDVIAAAAATQSGGLGGRRTIYLFNGLNGQILWQSPLLGFTHGVTAIGDISGDGAPDVIGAVGEPSYKASAFSGTNGGLLWDFAVPSGSGGGKEVLALPIPGQTPDLILGAFWGPVYRVDGETGTQVWSSPTGNSGVMQLARLRDITGDGIDEILVALLGQGARCLNGATGAVIWSLPTGNTMGIAAVRDLNQDGFDDAAIAVQSQGAMIVRGHDGVQLALYPTSPNQAREIAAVPDLDSNYSFEIIVGGNIGHVAMISGGLDAGPVSVGEDGNLPQEFTLSQNYPNPFNPTTTILVSMPAQADLSLKIYDILGRLVRTFEYERVPPGVHSIEWDGKNSAGAPVASGVYMYQARSGEKVHVRRMVLVK